MSTSASSPPGVEREQFGVTPNGDTIERFTLRDGRGLEVRFLSWGGAIQSVLVPDRYGSTADVVLGFDTLDGYLADTLFLGPLVGRYANRIARGQFTLDGREYVLPVNDGPHHLHGGPNGFHRAVWDVEPFEEGRGIGATLSHVSPDGAEGYPGTLQVRVTYALDGEGGLAIDYHAVTDAPTPVSLTQHATFNLAGHGVRDVLTHELQLAASRFTPVDRTLVPTGELRPVAGTPFDFTTLTPMGARIDADDEQLRFAGGYDHNFVLDRPDDGSLVFAARLLEPKSGRTLEVHTTEPGLQLYTGNFLNGVVGKEGRRYPRRAGVALETQHFPDSPNHPEFPSTLLHPGEEYRSRTVYRFGVETG